MKVFGPDDNDGLVGLLNPHIEIRFIIGFYKESSIVWFY